MDYKAFYYQRKIGGSILATDTKNYIYLHQFLNKFNDFNLDPLRTVKIHII